LPPTTATQKFLFSAGNPEPKNAFCKESNSAIFNSCFCWHTYC